MKRFSLDEILIQDEEAMHSLDEFKWFVKDVKNLYKKNDLPLNVESEFDLPVCNYYLDRYLGNLNVSNLEIAMAIYNWMIDNIEYGKNGKKRNLRNARQTLSDKKGNCAEMAMLYVGLARKEGLYANYVRVEENYKGEKVSHACAVIRVRTLVNEVRSDRNDILVDPAYQMFGVQHRKFTVLSDEEVRKYFVLKQHETLRNEIEYKREYRLVA